MWLILTILRFHAVPLDILRVNISQSGSGRAGEVYYLNCSILNKIHGLVHNPNATWLTFNGEPIQKESGPTQIVGTSKSVLFFDPLKTSDMQETIAAVVALIHLLPLIRSQCLIFIHLKS